MLNRIAAVAVATVIISLAVLVTGVWTGASEAAEHAVPGLMPSEEEFAHNEARYGIWNNLFEHMLDFSMAVTRVTPVGDGSCNGVAPLSWTP